jgi:hypothetical protein
MALNFTMGDVLVISDERMDAIETGAAMPEMDYKGP